METNVQTEETKEYLQYDTKVILLFMKTAFKVKIVIQMYV